MISKKGYVYCAGPLFTEKEKEEMSELASALEEAGFKTFLPHRDGLELTTCSENLIEKGLDPEHVKDLVSRAIFALDVYKVVIDCDAIIVNLNGRVPDEGAISEAALAWCANKIVIGYKTDTRSVLMGKDNPLVAGLFDFKLCDSISKTVNATQNAFKEKPSEKERVEKRGNQLRHYLDLGSRIWDALREPNGIDRVADILCERLLKQDTLIRTSMKNQVM